MPRTLSPRHKAALAAGRARAAAKRREGCSERVAAWRAWLKKDTLWWEARLEGKTDLPEREPSPPLPTDFDFRVSRGEE